MALDMRRLFGGGMVGKGPRGVSIRSVSVGGDPIEEADGRVSAARAIIKAIRGDDPEALDVALEDHYRACEGSEGGSDEAEGSDSESDDGDHEYR